MVTGIGETLRAARRRNSHSLADAAAEIRVRESYLAALEEEDFAALGGDVYVKGFLRSYARFIGLDPEPLLETYRREHQRPDDPPPTASRPVSPMGRERPSGTVIGVAAAVALLLVLALVGLFSGGDDPADQLPAVGPSPAPEPSLTVAESVAPLDPDAPASPGAGEVSVSPTATDGVGEDATETVTGEEVEVVVTIDGGISYLLVVVDGEEVEESEPSEFTETYTATERIRIVIGNAGVVSLTVNGEDLGVMGADAEVVERTFVVEGA